MDKNKILERAKSYIKDEKDASFAKEVEDLIAKEDFIELEDRFYRNLEFGTGGLRGIIGGGTNRINTFVINKRLKVLQIILSKHFLKKLKRRTRCCCCI